MENDQLRQSPPKTWLVESILVTLFCCLPFGIVGIINAAKVESTFYSGDHNAANTASTNAKQWTSFGFWIGIIGVGLYFLLIMAGVLSVDDLL
jgi:hypothetical protein